MSERPRQRDCRYEPAYPMDETVVFSLSDPDRVVHTLSSRCYEVYPHLIKKCGEFEWPRLDGLR